MNIITIFLDQVKNESSRFLISREADEFNLRASPVFGYVVCKLPAVLDAIDKTGSPQTEQLTRSALRCSLIPET